MQTEHEAEQCIRCDNGQVVPYAVRTSRRARRVTLRYNAMDGLVVVVPDRFDVRNIPHIVAEKREWIARVATQYGARSQQLAQEPDLPQIVALQSVGREYRIVYTPSSRPFSVTVQDDSIAVSGRISPQRVQKFLRTWLRQEAERALPHLLNALASKHGIQYADCRIRMPRARWGSCSAANVIHLNARLMFLPAAMVEYVCMHELAHCIHHNHSSRYWAFLDSLLPGARTRDTALKEAWRYVPRWSLLTDAQGNT